MAPSTLRTWDRRYGIGPSVHVQGSHRRYTPRDVARLECMQLRWTVVQTPRRPRDMRLTQWLRIRQKATADRV
nr:MerR family transcriptional regulator [Rhodococcus wratislaviensis]